MNKQEPVATIQTSDPYDEREGLWFDIDDLKRLKQLPAGTKLYTHPAPSWQGLSDDDINKMWEFYNGAWYDFAMAIEQALKEKNHG